MVFDRLLSPVLLADPRCRGQNLESFLIMPIQRVPRYLLLLTELRKRTPADHRGLEVLSSVAGASLLSLVLARVCGRTWTRRSS